jgi:hypothetical protein
MQQPVRPAGTASLHRNEPFIEELEARHGRRSDPHGDVDVITWFKGKSLARDDVDAQLRVAGGKPWEAGYEPQEGEAGRTPNRDPACHFVPQ